MNHSIFILFFTLFFVTFAYSQNKDEYYKQASKLYDAADYTNALQSIDKALSIDSTNVEYLCFKGSCLEKKRKYQEAYHTYTLANRIDPKNPQPLNQRGLLLLQVQETEYAIKDFDTALRLQVADRLKLSLLVNRGAAKMQIRDFESAYADFISALEIDSLNVGVLNNLATVCDEIGKGDQTLDYLFKIIKIDSTFIGAYVNLGFKHQGMEDYKKAITFFNKAIEIDPKEALAYSNRSFSYYKLGDFKNALSDVNLSIKLYPANSYAYRIRGLIYFALKEKQKGCEDLEVALELGFTKTYGNEVEQLKKEHCK